MGHNAWNSNVSGLHSYCHIRFYPVTVPSHQNMFTKLVILYFQDTQIMGVFTRSISLLALLFQSKGERVTFTHKPLIDKVCSSSAYGWVAVRGQQYCHWHCMKNKNCFAVNYNIDLKRCYLLSPCDAISDVSGFILTVYGNQEHIRSLLQNQ